MYLPVMVKFNPELKSPFLVAKHAVNKHQSNIGYDPILATSKHSHIDSSQLQYSQGVQFLFFLIFELFPIFSYFLDKNLLFFQFFG